MATWRKLPPAVREDAPSGTFKVIDTLDQLMHEHGHKVEDRLAAATDILR